MHSLPPCYWEPNYARELYTCPASFPQPLPGRVLSAWLAIWSETESAACSLFARPVREDKMVSLALVVPRGLPGCPRLSSRSARAAGAEHPSTWREGCLPVGPICPACCLLGNGRAILAVKPQKWASCLWPSPRLSVLWTGDPELISSSATAEDGLLCGACAIAKWITLGKGIERQLQCRKCFVHQLSPILHPERLKAVCLQLCVMSCSVCHLISSPGIIRHA